MQKKVQFLYAIILSPLSILLYWQYEEDKCYHYMIDRF